MAKASKRKSAEGPLSRALGNVLILFAVISLLILFDNLPNFYSGYITKAPPPQAVQPPGLAAQNANPSLSALSARLLAAENDYRNGPVEAKASKLQPMVDAAKARHDLMLSLIDENPSAVLDNAFGADVRKELSPEIQPYLEQDVDVEGDFTFLHLHDYSKNTSKDYYSLKISTGERISLDFASEGPALLTG